MDLKTIREKHGVVTCYAMAKLIREKLKNKRIASDISKFEKRETPTLLSVKEYAIALELSDTEISDIILERNK